MSGVACPSPNAALLLQQPQQQQQQQPYSDATTASQFGMHINRHSFSAAPTACCSWQQQPHTFT
jgi:hypothetical protein